jgi:hypothetical protein
MNAESYCQAQQRPPLVLVLSRTNQLRTFTPCCRKNPFLLPFYLCVRFPHALLPPFFPIKTFHSGRPIFLISHSVQPSIILAKFYEDRTFRTSIYRHSLSQWSHGRNCGSTAARLLRSWVRIPPEATMPGCCECCVLSGRGLCDELLTRPEEFYRVWCVVVCDQETSCDEEAIDRAGLKCQKNNKKI